ncbi:MAG: hypothetical protein IPP43_15025 [Chitinophagaceae bacterium]|nr:hypothetical protein [Chitinophagaceae bacterium]MBL0132246.1 hypothetical protein [Chitinophagaceae bacterium]
MKRKKIIRYVLLSLLLIGGTSAIYIYKEYNRTHKDTARLKPVYSLTATDLEKEFEGNETASTQKYADKVLRVEGIVKEVVKDDKGFYTVVLGDTLSMSSVRCSIDSLHSKDVMEVKKGTTLAVKGICSGFNADEMLGSDVILIRSVVDLKN